MLSLTCGWNIDPRKKIFHLKGETMLLKGEESVNDGMEIDDDLPFKSTNERLMVLRTNAKLSTSLIVT